MANWCLSLTLASLVLMGCSTKTPVALASTTKSSSQKSLPIDRWDSAQRPSIPAYPPLARLAGIQGDLVMSLEVNEKGRVISTKLISGSPQLAAAVDRYARNIQFNPESGDFPGPWAYSITARFDLKGFIGISPTGRSIVLEPVSTPPPSFSQGPK